MFFTASIVIYNTNKDDLKKCLESLLSSDLISLVVIVDNGASKDLDFSNSRIKYIKNINNIGYGAAQNVAIEYVIKNCSFKYHIFCNPDVCFDKLVLSDSYYYLEKNDDIGILGPKIIFPDGSLYPSARLLPSAMSQFCRFFLKSFSRFFLYELNDYNYNTHLNIPFVCGAFCIVKKEVFFSVGFFDERFFLYQEDIDFSRRVHEEYRTIIYPKIEVKHKLGRESHKKIKMTFYHIASIIKFYNKWGWFFDKDRKQKNDRCLKELNDINL